MPKKTLRNTKKKGGLSFSNTQQLRNMAATAKTHLANAQPVMNSPAVQKALDRHDVQGHVKTAVAALLSAAQKAPHPLASTMLNRAATTVGTTLKRGCKRSATKKAKRSHKGKKH